MKVQDQIKEYISGQSEDKQKDMQLLHKSILKLMPKSKLWFLDGRNSENKVVSNPNIGYGSCLIKYADGSSKEFYRIGLSGNTAGISIYIMGLKDKTSLLKKFGKRIGKASVTGYCIKFKSLKDIDQEVLEEAILYGVGESN